MMHHPLAQYPRRLPSCLMARDQDAAHRYRVHYERAHGVRGAMTFTARPYLALAAAAILVRMARGAMVELVEEGPVVRAQPAFRLES